MCETEEVGVWKPPGTKERIVKRLFGVRVFERLARLYLWGTSFFSEKRRFRRFVFRHSVAHKEEFFYKCMRFLQMNRIPGDYLEFGCAGEMTFRLAHKYIRLTRIKRHLYGFDSFEGLPQPKGIDIHPQWKVGDMKMSMSDFIRDLRSAGLKETEYTLIPGFFSQTLTQKTQNKLGLKPVACIYLDCDLYESTVPALNFLLPLLQTGTIIAFDDFYCFNGDPERGQQLALREFLQRNPQIKLVEYLNIGWHGKSFIVKKRN